MIRSARGRGSKLATKRKPVRKTRQAEPGDARALHAALDALPVGFALFDAGGRLAAWNARLAGLKLFPKRLLKKGSALGGFRAYDKALSSRVARPREIELRKGVVLRATMSRVPPGYLLVTYEDVTAQRNVETELGRVRTEAAEALERQTATSEILKVISGSPASIQPVFDAILDNATRLCEAHLGFLSLYDGEKLETVAHRGANPEFAKWVVERGRFVPSPESAMGQMIAHPRAIQFDDYRESPGYRNRSPMPVKLVELGGVRSFLAVPMLTEKRLVGNIILYRPEIRGFTQKQVDLLSTFADQAVIAIENARLFNETQEALQRQTATAEILKVISQSPDDLQPVFDAILERATRLCEAELGFAFTCDGQAFDLVAQRGLVPERIDAVAQALHRNRVPGPQTAVGMILSTRHLVHIPDVRDTDAYRSGDPLRISTADLVGARTLLAVPLLRDARVVGAVVIYRREVRPFADKQLALLQIFADQAAIAIENVRLFNETKEALERQTATAEILKVISGSPTDVQPTFDAIVQSAARLFGCNAAITMIEGDWLHLIAMSGTAVNADRAEAIRRLYPIRMEPELLAFRAIETRSIIEIPDIDGPRVSDRMKAIGQAAGIRSAAIVPLIRDGKGIGVLALSRSVPGLQLGDKQRELVQTFADQAVIAIENVRLFNELEARNREVSEALERQTATAEILKVIASSPSNVQPVFDAIASSAMRLFDGLHVMVALVRDNQIVPASRVGPPELVAKLESLMPLPLNRESLTGRIIVDREALGIPDMEASGLPEYARTLARSVGMRGLLGAPMLREGEAIGAIMLAREKAGEFTPKQIALLETFADQAVIAIENTRLFNETKEALERQTATAEVLRVISSSPSDVQPVFQAIVDSALRLCDGVYGGAFRFDGERVHLSALAGFTPEAAAAYRSTFPLTPTRDNISARAIVDRNVIHVADIEADASFPISSRLHEALDFRAVLAVPMLRDGQPIGAITVARRSAGPFPANHVALLQTFADQAVIAIENVRLFNETKEALERQTATAEILKVISESPTDVQPVFVAIAESAARLFAPATASIHIKVGDLIHLRSITGPLASKGSRDELARIYPVRFDPERSISSWCIREMQEARIADTEAPGFGAEMDLAITAVGRAGGHRSGLLFPLVNAGVGIGLIGLTHPEPEFKLNDKQQSVLKTFADQAVIAIENVRLFNETKEALERQTATAEVLQVISSSVADTAPVFKKIIQSCEKLFGVEYANIALVGEDGLMHLIQDSSSQADERSRERLARVQREFPRPVRDSIHGYAIYKGKVLHFPDVANGPDVPDGLRESAKWGHNYSALYAPMFWEGKGIGTLAVHHLPPSPFSDNDIALLKTFADQAVIAIQNARLFNETREALERQTATAEILRVISESPTDTQPVFNAIVQSGLKLFPGSLVSVALRYGDAINAAAVAAPDPARVEAWRRTIARTPLARNYMHGAALLDRRIVDIADVADAPAEFVAGSQNFLTSGNRAITIMPMMRGDNAIGLLSVVRLVAGPLSDRQRGLLRTFADQAVIAIENVRLFNETKEALERQTATAEILKVISESPTDVQPAFDAIVESAVRLCDAAYGAVLTVEEQMVHLRAAHTVTSEGQPIVQALFPMRLDADHLTPMAIRERRVIRRDRLQDDPAVPETSRKLAVSLGYQSLVIIPMRGEGRTRGAVVVTSSRPFTDHQASLLQTFTDQAEIAIENVRLFNETKEALERQTATAEILKVISESPTDVQPVFDAIANSAQKLLSGAEVGIALIRGDRIELVAAVGVHEEQLNALRASFPRPLELQSGVNRTAVHGETIHYPDTQANDVPAYTRDTTRSAGIAAMLGVPLLREGKSIGGVFISKTTRGGYSEKQIELLQTFADQAVIAIENVRLFNETKEALERQTATAEILKVISESPTDVQPVFDAIVESCTRLLACNHATLRLVKGDRAEFAASNSTIGGKTVVESPMSIHDDSLPVSHAVLRREVVQIPDTFAEGVSVQMKQRSEQRGFRSLMVAPLLRENHVIGTINVHRATPGRFTDKEVALLETFASQAVIAIQNVRLFNETKEALERQTATAEILKVISESPTDMQPVFDAIVQSCVRLFDGLRVALNIVHGDTIDRVAISESLEAREATADVWPMPLDDKSLAGRATLTGELVHIADLGAETWIGERSRSVFSRLGVRSALCAPMLREGRAVGSIIVLRGNPGYFKGEQVTLLKTFADQAVIAIENVRLFKELQERTEALTKSVGQLTALGEVSQTLSSTLDLDKVLQTIVSRAVQLTGLDAGAIYEYDEEREVFNLRGGQSVRQEIVELDRDEPVRIGEGAIGRAAETRQPVQVADLSVGRRQTRGRDVLLHIGARALLAVPLLREGHILGALAVTRNTPGEFPPDVIALLETFAAQSAIAIQNARLFREIEDKSRQLELASQHKSQFLASMSHELRTPLNAILGFNELIIGGIYGEIADDMRPPLEQMQSSGKHLLNLINNVLDLAKIEANKMELALADYAVQDTVAMVRSTLQSLATEKGLELVVSVPEDLPLAHGDGGRLSQCLINLAGNAIKFTKEGRVEIRVALEDETLRYSVVDTGIGIPPEKIDSLFTEFKQTDATVASEYGGTGLGLSITKKFIEMHGGRIWVESEPGKGSSFIFELPLRVTAGVAA